MNFDLDLRNRSSLFQALAEETFDVAVIGGGITGAGIARDAAMRGLRVALLEARDFAAGTSSRSSKLVHGGLRYLAQGDMALVREAASERKAVAAIAPHLARSVRFVVTSRSRAGMAKFKAGLWTYEKLGGIDADERHEMWDVKRLAAEEPHVRTEGLAGAVVFTEYVTDDGRLTLANIRSAKGHGAVVANYAQVTAIGADHVLVRDALTDKDVRVSARTIVNASGPWADSMRRLEDADSAPRLALSKGVHVVLNRTRLPITNTITMNARDKRGVFVVPRGPMAYLGTTDTFYSDSEYWPRITTDDIDYLLEAANDVFDVSPLTHRDVAGLWSGIRPLISQAGKSPSEISRRDEIMEGPLGMITIAGGKLTAYRRMAERIVDRVMSKLSRSAACTTASEHLPGGDMPPAAMRSALSARGLNDESIERLVLLYGSESTLVADGVPSEVTHAVLKEGAVTLEDYWVRRSARAHFDPDGGLAVLDIAARTMAPLLGWTDEQQRSQLDHCHALNAAEMGVLRKSV